MRDIGVYPAITTRFVTGAEPTAVPYARIDWDGGIDATARAVVDFPGFTLDFYVSMRLAPRQVMTFHGDGGWLSVHAPFNAGSYGDAVLELRNADARIVLERFPAPTSIAPRSTRSTRLLDGAAYPCPLEYPAATSAWST